MRIKRMIAFMLCIVLSLTSISFSAEAESDLDGMAEELPTIYVSESGSDSRGDGSESSPYASLQKAYDASGEKGRIEVSGTIVIDDYMNILKFSADKEVEIYGQPEGIILYDGDQNIDPKSAVMKITAGKITLRNITVKMPDIRGKNGRVLYISDGGKIHMEEGTIIENGYLAASSGNIYVGKGGYAVLDGGIVRNGYLAISNADAYGAGVFVDDGGTFLMKAGEISGNTAKTTVSSYRTFGGGAAVMNGGTFEMDGGKICGNTVETAGAGLYLEEGANVLMNAAASAVSSEDCEAAGSSAADHSEGDLKNEKPFYIWDNLLSSSETQNLQSNMYFAEKAVAGLSGSMEGAKIGITCEDDYYGRVVFQPAGDNTISPSDESAFFYDGGAYDVRMDSFTKNEGNLILWHWAVGVEIVGEHILSSNPARETPVDRDYETVITPDEGYELPEQIAVVIGGKELDPDAYFWDPEAGEIRIGKEQIDGDIVIRINTEEVYELNVSCSNVSADRTSISVTYKDEVQIVFHTVRKYGLPEKSDIDVRGICDWNYDEDAGILTVSHAEEDVFIAAEGSKIKHVILFDPAGGTLKPGEETKEFYESDPTYGDLPEPEKEGYHFDGWFDSDGNKVTEDTPNDDEDDITLEAHWSAKTDITYTINHYIEYTDSGINPETESTDKTAVNLTDTFGRERTYYLYASVEYYDGLADSVQTLNDRLMDCDGASMNYLSIDGFSSADINQYEYKIEADGSTVINWYYNRKDVAVYYNGNGGTASQAETSVKYGSCFGTLAAAERDGYSFDGWFTDPRGGRQINPDEICMAEAELILYAHWEAKGTTEYRIYHRIQNLENNRVDDAHTLANTTLYQTQILYGTSDVITDLYAMAIDGFIACPDNRYQVYINADGSASAVLYYDRLSAVVKYDANGGTIVSDADLQTKIWYGGVMGAVQAPPYREGYLFTGWYTAAEGGVKVDENTEFNVVASDGKETCTVFAHWKKEETSGEPQKPSGSGSGGGSSGSGGSGTSSAENAVKEEDKPGLTGDHIKYLNGYPDRTFRADKDMTRAETVQMFYNLLEKTAVGSSDFRDVSAFSWYAEAVGALSEAGIIEGYPDKTFRPDDSITRAEFVMTASRFFDLKPAAEIGFNDVEQGSWYYDVIASAAKEGWLEGYPDGTFRPNAKISRAEAAAITNRLLGRESDPSYIDADDGKIISFSDLNSSFWAYYTIMEAANGHDFKIDSEKKECWLNLI